jgi:hypothetical protein
MNSGANLEQIYDYQSWGIYKTNGGRSVYHYECMRNPRHARLNEADKIISPRSRHGVCEKTMECNVA